ncbi:MAG TPA: ABC-type transport auxiliary lipoprotein family protein [Myxococcales bacterium]|nr:ABC-type transport auxiliary lipoprotein family protein [Myxococcales bacterium]
MRRSLVFLASALAGCALLGKNEPGVPRYYTPEYEGDAPSPLARSDLQLRLGRVEGWSHVRERMVVRNSTRELFYYEDRHWTERPEIYLRRALSRTLFEERGVVASLSGRDVTLDVELIAFEEIQEPHLARMQVLIVLRDDRTGLLEETITVERPVSTAAEGEKARAVADALSQALHAGVVRVADDVVRKLSDTAPHATRGR